MRQLARGRTALIALVALACAPTGVGQGASAETGQFSGTRGCVSGVPNDPAKCRHAPGLLDPRDGVVSPDGRHLYVAATGSDRVITLRRDASRGASVRYRRCVGTGVRARGCKRVDGLERVSELSLSSDGRRLYAASGAGRSLVVFRRNRTTGALQFLACAAVAPNETRRTGRCTTTRGLDDVQALAAEARGGGVYAAQDGSSAVVRFALRGRRLVRATGQGACVVSAAARRRASVKTCMKTPGLQGARDVTLGPRGREVYAVGAVDGSVVRLSRSRTGALRPASCVADARIRGCDRIDGLSEASAISLSGDGASAYVAAPGDNAIVSFVRAPSGNLDPIGCFSGDPALPCQHSPLAFPQTVAAGAGGMLYAGDPGRESVVMIGFTYSLDRPGPPPIKCISSDPLERSGCPRGRRIGATSEVLAGPRVGEVYAISQSENAIAVLEPLGP